MFDKKLLLQHINNTPNDINEQNKAIKEGLDHLGVSHAQSRGEPLFPGDRGAGAGQHRPQEGPHGSYITFGSYEFPVSLHPVDGWIHGHVGSDGKAGTHRRMVYSKQPPPGPEGTPLEDHHLSTDMRREMGRDAMRDIGLEEQMQSSDFKSAVAKAVLGIKKIDRAPYINAGSHGDRLYQAEVKMHIDKAKNQFHPKYHDEIHELIMKAI